MTKQEVTPEPEGTEGANVKATGDNLPTANPNDALTHNPDIPPEDRAVLPTAEELLALGTLPEPSRDVATLLEGMKERGQEADLSVWRYANEDLWRYGGNAYCAIPGIQGWRPLEEGVRLSEAGFITPQSFAVLSIKEPPGGGYGDIYAVPDSPHLYRAATLAGDFYLDGTNWILIPPPAPAGMSPAPANPSSPDDRPATELSVRIRRIRGLL